MCAEGVTNSDLHPHLFNIGAVFKHYNEAQKAVEQFGVFWAINVVKNFEIQNFGTDDIKITPGNIADMLFYIAGWELLARSKTLNGLDYEDLTITDLKKIQRELNSYINSVDDDLVKHLLNDWYA